MPVVRKDDSSMIDECLEGEESPRHRKVSKKRHVRSDHKHEYEWVCIDVHAWAVGRNGRHAFMYVGNRCRVCGRLGDVVCKPNMHEPPEDMRLFEVEDFIELMGMTHLPDDAEVTR